MHGDAVFAGFFCCGKAEKKNKKRRNFVDFRQKTYAKKVKNVNGQS